MEQILKTILETSVSQSQQIMSLCVTLENVLMTVEKLHERISVLEGQKNQNTHSRN